MIRPIVQWPNAGLKQKCKPVKFGLEASQEDRQARRDTIQDLKDTLAGTDGIGLAANQIGSNLAILVADLAGQGVTVLINPTIVKSGDWMPMMEGCLSIPGVGAEVRRANVITVEYVKPGEVEPFIEMFEGRDAQILQHEVEHLQGVVFIDHLPAGKRDAIRSSLRKGKK